MEVSSFNSGRYCHFYCVQVLGSNEQRMAEDASMASFQARVTLAPDQCLRSVAKQNVAWIYFVAY
jgi:hypothetical protein